MPAPSLPVASVPEHMLDMADLTSRLRESKALGTFAKLSLRRQMDDLLERFRILHLHGPKSGLASLRRPYEALLVKVVLLLQTGDPGLAHSIEISREAIWAILSDPEKFKAAT